MDEQAYREVEGQLWAAFDAQPTERWVHLPRLGSDVRIQEVGDGDPVLYLHGGPNAGATWVPVAAQTRGLRSLLVDRPGTGLSPPRPIPPDELPAIADTFVADVLDAADLERAHVVASSFGGFLALRSAAATPDRFGRMVQMACPAGAPGMAMPGFMRAMATPGLGRLIAALPPNERAARSILRQIGHGTSLDAGRIPQVFMDWYLGMQRHTDTMRNDGRLVSSLASPRGRWHPALALSDELLAQITVPTSFLWGADDSFGGEDTARHITETMADATVEMLADAGHLPWLDDPTHAARAIETFLHPPVEANTTEQTS